MMQFVDNGCMSLFRRMVCVSQAQGRCSGLLSGVSQRRELGCLIHPFKRPLLSPNYVPLWKVEKNPSEYKCGFCPEGAPQTCGRDRQAKMLIHHEVSPYRGMADTLSETLLLLEGER